MYYTNYITDVAGDCNLTSHPPSNRVFTEGTCKLLKLVISDLVDEDFVVNRRPQAASALLFGMVALLTKPGQTFAPLIGTWLLCAYTGTDRNTQTGSFMMKCTFLPCFKMLLQVSAFMCLYDKFMVRCLVEGPGGSMCDLILLCFAYTAGTTLFSCLISLPQVMIFLRGNP